MSRERIDQTLASLPGTNDVLFRKLLTERRLLFDGQPSADATDIASASLIAAAIRRKERLLITLPDVQPRRPAFLFATALIRHFLDLRTIAGVKAPRNDPILYFGPHIGIRDQLRRTKIAGLALNLSEVFSQFDVKRAAGAVGSALSNRRSNSQTLPRVVTVYSPADARAFLQGCRPCWIALDCGDAQPLHWLASLLQEATSSKIPVIAWGQNPLSQSASDFAGHGRVFTWPPAIRMPVARVSRGGGVAKKSPEPTPTISISPVLLKNSAIAVFSEALQLAGRALNRAVQEHRGRFAADAIAIHWRYLRSLESLAVPLEFYESEASRFYGLRTIAALDSTSARFRQSCVESDDLQRLLEDAATQLSRARDNAASAGSGLWNALRNLCVADPASDEVRIVTFPSDSRKRLFLFALLARYNLTEDDMRNIGTFVASFDDLRRWVHTVQCPLANGVERRFTPPTDVIWRPLIVGLPSPRVHARLLCALTHPRVDLLIYEHQYPAYMRQQSEWQRRMGTSRNAATVAQIAGTSVPTAEGKGEAIFEVKGATVLDVETTKTSKKAVEESLWAATDEVTEIARLFNLEDEGSENVTFLNDRPESDHDGDDAGAEDLWRAEAISIHFEYGWRALFSEEEQLNVEKGGSLDLRYVRSLKTGDRVVLIHGQQRQSLYDLIISRVHRHPSIELHLAMIRRWQEELRIGYARWRSEREFPGEDRALGARDLNGLLRRMQLKGSGLVASLTLSLWLRGLVLSPLDSDDLKRVAEILDINFVRQNYRTIGQAANRLRGLHRGLSHKLSRWLQDHVSGQSGQNDDVIDADLGLTFSDVQNSLLVLRVLEIERVAGPFLASTLGRLEKE